MGWAALQLIQISSEVSTSVLESSSAGTTTTSKNVPPAHFPPYYEQPHFPFYNSHIFENQQQRNHHQYPVIQEGRGDVPPPPLAPPHFSIPYEYLLYHKWHQQQRQLQQQHQQSGSRPALNFDSQHDQLFHQRRQDGTLSSWYTNNNNNNNMHWYPPAGDPGEVPKEDDSSLVKGLSSHAALQPSKEEDVTGNNKSEEIDTDEQSKIFRSVLHHRKNFKGGPPRTMEEDATTLQSPDLKAADVLSKNSETEKEDMTHVTGKVTWSSATVPPATTQRSQRKAKREEGGHVPKDFGNVDWSSLLFLREEGKQLDKSSGISSSGDTPDYHYFSPAAAAARQRDQDTQQVNMMTYAGKFDNPQRPFAADSDAGHHTRKIGERGSRKNQLDFKEQYAKVLLVCGLLALCTVVFQFLTSFLLLCFVDKVGLFFSEVLFHYF